MLAIAAVTLPSYGPLLDASYAERLPGHAYLLLGDPLLAHSHSYEVQNAGADTTGEDGGVVATPGAHESGGYAVIIAAMLVLLLVRPAVLGAAGLLGFTLDSRRTLSSGLDVGPDAPPPRSSPAS